MGWGRIDDGFDEHPKVLALLDDEDPTEAAAAIGLWSLCFTWAHRNTRKKGKTPGLLPAGLPRRYLGGMGRDLAKLLVKHHLWEEHPDGGWKIHDFEDYLPDADTRAARSEAGKRGAAKRWAAKHAADQAEEPESREDDGNLPLDDGNLPSACHDAASNGLANDGSRARVPTPIPEPEKTPSESSGGATRAKPKRGTRIPDDFTVTPAMVEWASTKVPHVDWRRETEKFINYWQAASGRNADKRDWVAAWRNWMLNAADWMPNKSRASPSTPSANETDLEREWKGLRS